MKKSILNLGTILEKQDLLQIKGAENCYYLEDGTLFCEPSLSLTLN
ncbi:hypothetical protein [Tenacibaculum agarivorans]|nr:hypothetical protein [Tenacibaculum agarivorans]